MAINFSRIIAVGLFFALSVVVLVNASGKDLKAAPRLALVGQFGDKKYYSEPGPYDWETAEAFCKANGMSLIAIETDGEHSYLRQVLVGEAGRQYYWTGGIESFYKFTDYFEWSNNGKKVQLIGGFQAFKSGVSFYPAGFHSWDITMKSYPISTQLPILCQQLSSAFSLLPSKVREVDPNVSVRRPQKQQ